jgi:hypothetical protein
MRGESGTAPPRHAPRRVVHMSHRTDGSNAHPPPGAGRGSNAHHHEPAGRGETLRERVLLWGWLAQGGACESEPVMHFWCGSLVTIYSRSKKCTCWGRRTRLQVAVLA